MDEERLLDSDDSDESFEEEAPKPKRENSTIRRLREAQEAAAKERDDYRQRVEKYEELFLAQSDLAEAQAKALRASGYEVTPEGINAFKSEVLGVAADTPAAEPQEVAEGDEVTDVTPEQAGFVPTRQGGQVPSSREYTSQDIVELMQTDPAKADKLLRSGKVVRKEFNPGGPRF